jgi:hypothetical protein
MDISSYKDNYEIDVRGDTATDTAQWWIGLAEAFRVRTFAIDHDIHVHNLNRGGPPMVQLALGNHERVYKAITWRQYIVAIEDPTDRTHLDSVFAGSGIAPTSGVWDRFAWWNPDGGHYEAQSAPVDERHRRTARDSRAG